jgi:hypothetical protein
VSIADAAAELAELAGVTLSCADLALLEDGMRAGEGRRWAVSEVTVPDSDDLLLARVLAGLFLLEERVLVTCHPVRERGDAVFRRFRDAVTASGLLARQVKRVSAANGDQRIETAGGGRVQFTSLAGARGYSADLVVIYGGQAFLGRARQALRPVAAGRPDPQIWYSAAG